MKFGEIKIYTIYVNIQRGKYNSTGTCIINLGASLMPLYHFNVQDGQNYPDLSGSEYPDLEGARTEAVRRSGELLRDNAQSFWGGNGWKLVVTDEAGMILFTLHFLAVSSPATERYGADLPELPPNSSAVM